MLRYTLGPDPFLGRADPESGFRTARYGTMVTRFTVKFGWMHKSMTETTLNKSRVKVDPNSALYWGPTHF